MSETENTAPSDSTAPSDTTGPTERTGPSESTESPAGRAVSNGETVGDLTVDELRDWLRNWVSRATGVAVEQISDDRPMEEFGLASRDAVALAADVEDFTGVILTATAAYNHPTIASLAKRIIEGDPDEGLDVEADRFWERERSADDDIAIVGLATRFPKAGTTPESTWEALISGVDGITDLPDDRWLEFKADPRLAEAIEKGNVRGGYLDDVTGFDADFFQMSPREVENVDPQQRLALELTWEALEHAHIPPSDLRGGQVGVFMGTSTNDYQLLATLGLGEGASETAAYALTGTATSIIANRVSYFFDFHGPSLAIDTACSSSLVAVHEGVRSLRNGDSDVVIAGGVNMLITPAATLGFDQIGAQAPDGRIKAFSSDANGMIRAEGGGVFVLKRMADARRDGDTVLAVIAGSAVNSDGRSNGIFAPNPEAQVEVLRSAYADAAIDPRTVDYVEAHGTGTVLGDPIEADALGRVVGRGRSGDAPMLLGSAKTNFGHMESAAGAGALAKVVLSLQNDKLPASLNYAGPNPYIQFEATNLRVITEPTEWPRYSGHAVSGVSGFGFGGTNAHVVVREVLPSDFEDRAASPADADAAAGVPVPDDLDDDDFLTEAERAVLAAQAKREPVAAEAPEADPAEGFAPAAVPGAVVPLVISGFLASRRRKAAAELVEWLESDEGRQTPLAEIGRALAHRNHGRTRSVVMARTYEDAVKGMRAVAEGKSLPFVYTCDSPDAASAVWLLSGFGSQHRKMAKQLYTENPVFAKYADRVDAYIQRELGYSMVEIFLDDARTYEIETAQIGIYTIQVALADTMRHYGAEPGVLVPHSMGEASAAYISGGLSLEDATRVICQRSRLMGEGEAMLTGDAVRFMALVEYSAEDINDVLVDYPDLEICVYAAPTHTVIGGPGPQVDAIVARAEAEGKLGRKLQTKGASHTSQMDPLLGELSYEITGIEPQPLKYGVYSSVDRETFYRPGTPDVFTIDYYLKGLRHSVWFAQAIAKSVEAGHRTFVELSPNPAVLISVAATTFGAGVHDAELIETLRRKEDESYGLVNALMKLYVHGHPVDVAALFGTGPDQRFANIPRTRFERKPYWIDAVISGGSGAGSVPGAHVALPDGRHAWEVNAAAVTDPRELVLAAAKQVLGSGAAVAAVESLGDFPTDGTVTTTLTGHPGGAAISVHAGPQGGFALLYQAAVTGGTVREPVPSATGADAQTPAEAAKASGFVDEKVVVEDEVVDVIGDRWSPDSGESVGDRLAVIVGESMGYDPEDLPREIPLIELGLDSLMAVRIKNRVEYEFEIPQLQLQAMRQADLSDVEKFVAFAVTHRDQLDDLEKATGGGELDTAALNAYIDAELAKDALKGQAPDAPEPAKQVEPVEPTTSASEESSRSQVSEAPKMAETATDTPPAQAPTITDQASVAEASGTDVPPRDAAERLTYGAYAVVTGKSAGGVFNKLPVLDDETAEKLTERLNERTGGEIDVEDVLDSETIEELSNYVRQHMEASADIDGFVRFLRVPKNSDGTPKHTFDTAAGDPTPMLVFHPAGGNTSAYEALLKRLPDDQPVIGFDRVEGTIEERVRQYMPRLREVQPHGPYVLVGWSLGGALAYGAAQLLREEGEEIAFVGLIDVVRPTRDVPDTPENKRARLERWKAFAIKTYGLDEDVPIPMDRLVAADDNEQFAIITEMMSMSGTKIPGGIIEHQRTSFLDNRALTEIDPTPYDGKVVLYRADKMHDGAIELEPQWAEIDEDGRWGEVVDDLEIIHIGGDHLAIVDEPYVAKVAADLARRMADISTEK
ncbi:polyketide synthase Pks13 [Gordonia sp. PS3]|uniref:Polyketide synthase Pks13 n=1 Tax=Gordonia sihwensis NBRC 108236 TaxID=1223544 RepID=L7LKQ0_9ACTN|nr:MULTISPECIES: polyketide synthase Pks13 [Gordonia]AUH67369.1 polyketide synthase [Gordonia sp. YC-JH1]KJR06292.1 polyketide synthase [Gordonia sihwensis]MBY4570422.1 polyketide synthase [Gordonia sihwensis]GAC61720.1 polyketide synthase Pks13 [Gordonia sihwensis NBRC 108236]